MMDNFLYILFVILERLSIDKMFMYNVYGIGMMDTKTVWKINIMYIYGIVSKDYSLI